MCYLKKVIIKNNLPNHKNNHSSTLYKEIVLYGYLHDRSSRDEIHVMYCPIDVFFVSLFSNYINVTPEINTTHDAKFSQIGKHQLLSAHRISNYATSQMFLSLDRYIMSESDGTWQKMRPPGFS